MIPSFLIRGSRGAAAAAGDEEKEEAAAESAEGPVEVRGLAPPAKAEPL